MLLYAITQRSLFEGDEDARLAALLAQTRNLARGGIPYLQIREKDLPLPALRSLAASIVSAVRAENSSMKILLNGPASIALETGCEGIHLSSAASSDAALAVMRAYQRAGRQPIISAACHDMDELRERSRYAHLLLFAPVFEKVTPCCVIHGVGLASLSQAVQAAQGTPVLALGGVNVQNAQACRDAGAAGIAAIRLFLHEDWRSLVPAQATRSGMLEEATHSE